MERELDARTQQSVALKGGKDKKGLGWAQKAVVMSTDRQSKPHVYLAMARAVSGSH